MGETVSQTTTDINFIYKIEQSQTRFHFLAENFSCIYTKYKAL
ncbi:5927_t:CDS:1, partial [Entrophospora sp. SA101]